MIDSSSGRNLRLLSQYDYHLPAELIAQQPPSRRTDARLLDLSGNKCEDTHISDLPKLLRKGDVMVLNNTKVLPMRLLGMKETGGRVEVLISHIINDYQAEALIGSSRPPTSNSHILITNSRNNKAIKLKVIAKTGHSYLIESQNRTSLVKICHLYGNLPLPPYIHRPPQAADKLRYQTIFATKEGSAAAPTAGLHFTEHLINQIKTMGVKIIQLTLHIGLATFAPIRTNDITKHSIHPEWCHLSVAAAKTLNDAKKLNHRIISIGTTSLRTLETAYRNRKFVAYKGETSLFIHPESQPVESVDLLLTNFHLPRSSLLLLVCAFGGYNRIMQAYKYAVEKKYRFFSYGDAMLVEREI